MIRTLRALALAILPARRRCGLVIREFPSRIADVNAAGLGQVAQESESNRESELASFSDLNARVQAEYCRFL